MIIMLKMLLLLFTDASFTVKHLNVGDLSIIIIFLLTIIYLDVTSWASYFLLNLYYFWKFIVDPNVSLKLLYFLIMND